MAKVGTETKKKSLIRRLLNKPYLLVVIFGVIFFAFELFAELLKIISLVGLITAGCYTAGWLILSPNAPKWFGRK